MSGTASTATASKTPQTFTKKKITITFSIPTGAIGPNSDADTVVLEGHRCMVNVTNAGMVEGSQASVRIEGMTLAMMNRLTMVQALNTVDNPFNEHYNVSVITIQAGDDVSGMATVFIGTVAEAFVDFTASPNVAFQVMAWSTLELKIKQAIPATYKGTVSAATILSDLAAKNEYTFINHGVTKSLTNYYGWGSLDKQIKDVMTAINGFYHIDTVNKTISAWQSQSASTTATDTIKINKRTGLVGYPQYNQLGVTLTTVFNPQIQYQVPVYVESEYLPEGWVNNQAGQYPATFPTTGYWSPYLVQHDISSELPGGPWFTHIEAQRTELPKTQVTPTS